MAKKKDPKRQQKALERKAARRKEKRSASRPLFLEPRLVLRQAARWPLHECLLSEEWQMEGNLVQILVARRSPQGQVAAGTFLVDLGCLGVKSAFASLFDSQREYEQELRRRLTDQMPMMKADPNLAAKIIRESIVYARRLGFKPDPDYSEAMIVFGQTDPDACDVLIPLGGRDDKPLFIAGPYDNVSQIMAKLERALGPDGFHFLVPIGGDFDFEEQDDE